MAWVADVLGRLGRFFGREKAPARPPARVEAPLHLMTAGRTTVLCGDRTAGRWTIEVEAATCPPCLARGRLISIRRQTNER